MFVSLESHSNYHLLFHKLEGNNLEFQNIKDICQNCFTQAIFNHSIPAIFAYIISPQGCALTCCCCKVNQILNYEKEMIHFVPLQSSIPQGDTNYDHLNTFYYLSRKKNQVH